MNRFTLVQVVGQEYDHPTVIAWTPASYEQPGLTNAHKVLGVTMTGSVFQQQVAVMRRGIMRDVPVQNAEVWSVGDVLWAKADGTITKTRPSGPLPLALVGVVYEGSGGGNCTIAIDVRILPSLGELSGVSAETPADLDVFIYKSSTHVWEPRRLLGTDVSYTPSGSLSAVDVQAAIDELESKKADLLALYALGD